MTNNRKTLFIGSVLAVAVLAGIVGPWMFGSDHRQSTNDAYVIADYTVVAPKVAGFSKEVLVEDNQQVTAGQLLATIDARRRNCWWPRRKAPMPAPPSNARPR